LLNASFLFLVFTFMDILDKVRNKIEGWRSKTLS
jgi:hypothetical protein